jgi:hypothetical protein
MNTKLFIEELSKELGEELTLVQNKNYSSMASIYWKGQQVCSIPSGEIFEEHNPSYQNELGHAHRNIPTAKAQVISFIDRWNNEEGFKELMTEAI